MNKYITNIGAFSKPWPVDAIAAFTIQELIDILGSEFFELCDCRDFAAKQGKYLAVGGDNQEAYGETPIQALYNLILLLFANGELTFNK